MKNTNIGMKMRHNIKLFAACIMGAAMFLSSCEERTGGEGNIGFTADVASFKGNIIGSKAAPIGDPANDPDTYVPLFTTKYGTDGFTVSAYNGTTAKFTNAISSYNNGIWVLDPTAKWFSGETLDFYAMAAPSTTNGGVSNFAVNAASKQVTFDYTLPNFYPADQPDLMVGYYSGPGVEGTQAGVRVAPLTFYHPLSAIRLKAGDIADAGWSINTISISNVYHKGSCVIDVANLGTSTNAVTWTIDTDYRPTMPGDSPEGINTNIVGEEFTTAVTPVQGTIIGGSQESTFMVIPQTLNSTLSILFNTDEDTDKTYRVNLEDIELKPGKIYDITVNFKGIELETFDERTMIIPWDPQPAISYNDFELVPTTAYLCSGADFNTAIKSLGTVTKIIFDRGGSVDETGLQIQDPAHPEGYPIYASYDNGVVRITTHANTIHAHRSLKGMFEDMTDLIEIQWGLFFDTKETTDMSYMFSGCTSLLDINLTDVVRTINVTDMSHMFNNCSAATRIILGNAFKTVHVHDMSYMFNNCSQISSLNLGAYFDTRNVYTMDHMFANCSGLSAFDVNERFYTWKVYNYDYMFYNIGVTNLHFNSRFYIDKNLTYVHQDNPQVTAITARHMMENTVVNRRLGIYVTSGTWQWVNKPANTDYNGPADNRIYDLSDFLTQIIQPLEPESEYEED